MHKLSGRGEMSINESLFHTVYLTVVFLPCRFYGLFHKKWCAGSWWCSPCAFRGLFWWWPSGLPSEMTTGGLRWQLWGPLFCSTPCCPSAVWYSTAFPLQPAITWGLQRGTVQGGRGWLVARKSFLIKKQEVPLKRLQRKISHYFKNVCQSDWQCQ